MRLKINDLQQFDEMPPGWEKATLGKILPISYGKSLTKERRDESGTYPVFGSSGKVGQHNQAVTNKPSLIIGRKGSVGEVHYSKSPCWPIDTVYYAEEQEGFCLKFFEYLLKGLNLYKLDRSTAVPGLSRDDYNVVEVAIAPYDQQKNIVAEIEKQFSRLDEAVANLKRAKANLKRYKAAVLKAAVEGWLTEEWRKENPDVEPASELLERILTERRAKWKGKGKYKEPATPDISDFPPLPKGWTWARLEQLGLIFGGLTKNPKRAKLQRTLPYLRVANVYANELRLDQIEQIGVDDGELDKLLLQRGDLLIVEGNGSKDQIGRLAIWDGSIDPCVHQNHIIKVRLVNVNFGNWILFWMLSVPGRHYVEQVASSTSGLYTLSINKVGALPILLPPLSEQNRIVAEVERRLSMVEELEAAAGDCPKLG
jgi:type I restriction enzyme, S subunit